MILEGGVNHPALFLDSPLPIVLSEEAFLLPGRRPFWDGCRSAWIERAGKGSVCNSRIFIGRKDKPKVAVMPSAEVALDRRRVRCQELVELFDCRAIGLACVLGE